MNRKITAVFALVVASASLILIASVAKSSTVTVTASVTQTVACTTNISSTAFGTLSTAAVASSTPNASSSLSCNDGLGCTLSVQDQGNGASPGLATTSPAYLIPSTSGLLSAGTEGYGIQATTTAGGTGNAATVNTLYNVTSTAPWTGALSRSATTLASSTAQLNGTRFFLVAHYASIGATTQSGSYSDTITYSCTGN